MISIVLGLGFGDEGKGLVVDRLCCDENNASNASIVIRFSGGPQSGHTVVTSSGRHIFSNFGSGSLRGAPSYWTKYCAINPISLMNELEVLKKMCYPLMYIDDNCPVVTPYEVIYNQKIEERKRHGSCGVGFGATIKRQEDYYSLTYLDLKYPKILQERMKKIANYYACQNVFLDDQNKLDYFLEVCSKVRNCINLKNANQLNLQNYNNLVFEGSQGLLLDQNFGFFPNVTRSNVGLENIVNLYDFLGGSPDVYLVTRAYQTRHGHGFMTNEEIPHNIKENPLETNVENEWQGKFRRSVLDLSLIEYAIKKENRLKNFNKILVVTCLDHIVNEYRFTYNDVLFNFKSEKEFLFQISLILGIDKILLSRSDNSDNIEVFKYE